MAMQLRRLACAALAASLVGVGCGERDVTTLEAGDAPEALPEASESRTLAVLAQPDSVDAVCRLLGASASDGSARGERECSGVVSSCRERLGAALGAASPRLPGGDLEALFGCPLTVSELDGCIAGVLERSVAGYGASVGCDRPPPPALDAFELFASPECLGVAFVCPELISALAGGGARGGL